MTTIADPVTNDQSTFLQDTWVQVQEKYGEFAEYASQLAVTWKGRLIELKDSGLEKTKQAWEDAQPRIQSISDYFHGKIDVIKEVDWKGYSIEAKNVTLAGGKKTAGGALFLLQHLWTAIRQVGLCLQLLQTHRLPKITARRAQRLWLARHLYRLRIPDRPADTQRHRRLPHEQGGDLPDALRTEMIAARDGGNDA